MAYTNFENGVTPINDTNLNNMQKGIVELLLPVGSTYVTPTNTNPNTILGFGTWKRLKGRVCVGLDEDDTDFNTIGKTGGEKEVALTVDKIPSHDHSGEYKYNNTSNISNFAVARGTDAQALIAVAEQGGQIKSTLAGGGQAHNNLQPYQVVGYMWIRTA